jgi:hypothetical protein
MWGGRKPMKKAEAALLVLLPLGASWHLWHGYPSIAAVLMAGVFAIILGAFMRGRRDDRLKQEKLSEAARCDGRYIAQNIDEFRQPQVMSSSVVPADTRALLESLLSEITQSIRKG